MCLDGCDSLMNHLILRDHLKDNKLDRERYSNLKLNLVKKFPNDIDSYVEGKTSFILEILEKYDFKSDSIISIKEANKKRVCVNLHPTIMHKYSI